MTSRHREWVYIHAIANLYNPTTVRRYATDVEETRARLDEVKRKAAKKEERERRSPVSLVNLNKTYALDGMLKKRLKHSPDGTFYFVAELDGRIYYAHFDAQRELCGITLRVYRNGRRIFTNIRPSNTVYSIIKDMADRYNPKHIKPLKGESLEWSYQN